MKFYTIACNIRERLFKKTVSNSPHLIVIKIAVNNILLIMFCKFAKRKKKEENKTKRLKKCQTGSMRVIFTLGWVINDISHTFHSFLKYIL